MADSKPGRCPCSSDYSDHSHNCYNACAQANTAANALGAWWWWCFRWWLVGWWLVGCVVGWLVGCLARLVGWLAGWLVAWVGWVGGWVGGCWHATVWARDSADGKPTDTGVERTNDRCVAAANPHNPDQWTKRKANQRTPESRERTIAASLQATLITQTSGRSGGKRWVGRRRWVGT